MPQHAGYIDNEFTAGRGELLRVANPSDESEVASFPGLSLAQVGETIAVARRAFDRGDWSEKPAQDRAVVLRRFADALTRRTGEIINLMVSEAGCPRNAPVMNSQVRVPLRHAHEVIEFFLTLPEVEENPLPLADRITPLGQTPSKTPLIAPSYTVPSTL